VYGSVSVIGAICVIIIVNSQYVTVLQHLVSKSMIVKHSVQHNHGCDCVSSSACLLHSKWRSDLVMSYHIPVHNVMGGPWLFSMHLNRMTRQISNVVSHLLNSFMREVNL